MACDYDIELTIRDLKQHFGLGDYQRTTTLALIENPKAGWLQVVSAREPLPEGPCTASKFVGPCGPGLRGRLFLPMLLLVRM
jgi:hypothetical protein